MSHRRHSLLLLCSFLSLQPLALAQVTVDSLEQDLQGVDSTRNVVLTRLGSFAEEPVQRGMPLDVGDQLRSLSGKMVVGLGCPGGSALTLSEFFRIVITPPGADEDCGITLLSGGADFIGDQPTSLESGEVTLGSKRTQYGMRVSRAGRELRREMFVFEGEVEVSSPSSDRRQSISAGTKLIALASEWTARPVEPTDIQRTAAVYARLDTSKTRLAGPDARKVYSEFRSQHQTVLEKPRDPAPRLDLAVQQLNYGIASQVTLYQLDRAEKLDPRDTKQQAMILTTKGIAYRQLGKEDQAREQIQRAETIDPEVLQEATFQQYKLNPALYRQIKLPPQKLGPIRIKTAARPDSVEPGRPARLTVQAMNERGEPIEGATVTIRAGGGVFAESRDTTVTGTTDARGLFGAVWACRPCASGYVFGVEVSKPGHETATGEIRVKIG